MSSMRCVFPAILVSAGLSGCGCPAYVEPPDETDEEYLALFEDSAAYPDEDWDEEDWDEEDWDEEDWTEEDWTEEEEEDSGSDPTRDGDSPLDEADAVCMEGAQVPERPAWCEASDDPVCIDESRTA